MPILLAGGGGPEAVIPIDTYFVSAIDRQRPVLYIPIAMEPHMFTYDECYNWFQSTYAPYGITKTELCTDLTGLTLSQHYSAVFIGGGNTFKLLQAVQQSDFAKQIRAYVQAGGMLYGGSAGAILCGKTIASAAFLDENNCGLQDLSALDLLGGSDVFCHNRPGKEQDTFITHLGMRLYMLYEESGLLLSGTKETGIKTTALGKPFEIWEPPVS